jgi:chemotaxis protein MotB
VSAPSNRRRRRQEEPEEHADERWLLTYSDMITLLMALFIVMWAISSVNVSKFDQLKASLNSAFSGKILPQNNSVLTGQRSALSQDGAPVTSITQSSSQPAFTMKSIAASISAAAEHQDLENLKRIERQVESYAKKHGFAGRIRTSIDERGLVVRLLTDEVLFDSGQAVLKSKSLPLLAEISTLLTRGGLVNHVRVEGNTDNVPISGAGFPSNWELSSARADAVLQFLLAHGVAPSRLSATGYADQNPVASNATVEGRGLNRRVDLVVLRRTFAQSQGVSP